MRIADLLSHGQENAVPLRQLVALTNTDGRTIREKIAAERLAGVPILSDNATGYYLPGNNGEKERFVRSMRNRAREIERERREGRPILADNAIPATEHERTACVRSMRHRAAEILAAARAIEIGGDTDWPMR